MDQVRPAERGQRRGVRGAQRRGAQREEAERTGVSGPGGSTYMTSDSS